MPAFPLFPSHDLGGDFEMAAVADIQKQLKTRPGRDQDRAPQSDRSQVDFHESRPGWRSTRQALLATRLASRKVHDLDFGPARLIAHATLVGDERHGIEVVGED